LKYFLKSLKLKNETYFKSWHLLSLILSIEENKEESFKVTSFIINEIDEFLTESVNLSLLSPILKQIFIQVKITQLAIIESLFGIEQTLANLPEVFDLFNKLFQDSLDSTQQLDESFKEHKKSKSSTSSKLTKIKSIKPHKKQTQDIKTPSSTTTSSPYQFKSNHITEPKILQKLWILSSVIYAKAGLTTEAEQSLIDAEKSYHPTTELHATLAQLKSLSDPNAALQEYEKALTLDRKSLNVIVGFSNLLLNTDNKKLIFIDEKDTLAGLARVKLLLETVAETFEGSFNSEVWWLLSLIYEKFKDKKRLKESLWRSVELEETRGVRSFDSVEAWV
jgi:tetratricopeptide (TPR) repeat protein